jgi:serpin B
MPRRWRSRLLLVALTVAGAAGQQGDRMIEATSAQNAFGLKLLADLTGTAYHHKNVFVSPSSVFLALGMAELGAAGATRGEIRRALQVPADLSEEKLHASISAMSHSLRLSEGVELSIANALWADHQTPLAADFVAHCRELYEAEAHTLDFLSPDAADVINTWVKRATRNKIDGIVSRQAVAASKAILTNAVYFKGKWQLPFEKELTREGPFHLVSGGTKQVPFMRHPVIGDAYRSGDGYEGVALPYGVSGMELCVVLPAPGKAPEDILAMLQVAPFLNAYQPVELDLRLPRFSISFDASVKDALQRMGMRSAFRYGAAEFKPLGSPQFFIGDVLHRTRLEVDEEGTVAAAVTAIAMPTGAAAPRKMQKKVLIVDRPFALLLCDRRTGAILFAGVIYEP